MDLSDTGPLEQGRTAEFLEYWLEQRPDLDAEAMAIELAIARINLLSRKSVSRIAESMGVSNTDYRLMVVIRRGRRDGLLIRPSDLWKLFQITPGAVTYRVDRLVERGYVDRQPDADDRRVTLLRLTPLGEAKVAEVMTTLSALLKDRLQAVDEIPGGRTMLRRLLGALASRWEQTEDVEDEV